MNAVRKLSLSRETLRCIVSAPGLEQGSVKLLERIPAGLPTAGDDLCKYGVGRQSLSVEQLCQCTYSRFEC